MSKNGKTSKYNNSGVGHVECKLKCTAPDGSTYFVPTIASNRDHVANMVAEGQLDQSQRENHLIKLYEGQLAAKQRQLVETQNRLTLSLRQESQAMVHGKNKFSFSRWWSAITGRFGRLIRKVIRT